MRLHVVLSENLNNDMALLKSILVDFDGTLVNSESALAKAYKQALAEYGFFVSEDLIKTICIGRHWSKFLPEILSSQYSDELGRKIAAKKNLCYPDFFNQIIINEALLQLLYHLKINSTIALVTNASRGSVSSILNMYNIHDLFNIIICQEDVSNPKPHPESYLLAVTKLNVNKSNCIAIEDSEAGLLAARNAGISTLKISSF